MKQHLTTTLVFITTKLLNSSNMKEFMLINNPGWITKNGQRLQVPIEESSHVEQPVIAHNKDEAIAAVAKQTGFIITNIQVI